MVATAYQAVKLVEHLDHACITAALILVDHFSRSIICFIEERQLVLWDVNGAIFG